MPFFPSLPEDAGVATMWDTFNPKGREALGLFSRSFMRNEGKLTPADKEMIAAYSSLLNDSEYCYAGHSRVAINLGADPGVFDPLVQNIDTAPVRDAGEPPDGKPVQTEVESPPRMKPLHESASRWLKLCQNHQLPWAWADLIPAMHRWQFAWSPAWSPRGVRSSRA